jgi:hypothetical protein
MIIPCVIAFYIIVTTIVESLIKQENRKLNNSIIIPEYHFYQYPLYSSQTSFVLQDLQFQKQIYSMNMMLLRN